MLSLSRKVNMSGRRRCACKNRGFASHRHVSVAIGMTLREGAISFSAPQWFGSFVSLSVRCEYASLSSSDILDGYRFARRARRPNGSRKLERALHSSSDWRHNMRG